MYCNLFVYRVECAVIDSLSDGVDCAVISTLDDNVGSAVVGAVSDIVECAERHQLMRWGASFNVLQPVC